MKVKRTHVDILRRLSWAVVVLPLIVLQFATAIPAMIVVWILGGDPDPVDGDACWIALVGEWWLP